MVAKSESTSDASLPVSSVARKIWILFTPAERRGAVFLLCLMFIGMLLETLGVGLVIPAIAAMTQQGLGASYPFLKPLLEVAGNPDQQTLIIGGMLVLLGMYLIKTLYLSFLIWSQTRYSFDMLARLSQDLFAVYLHQPYTFHLQRNSAHLIRNIMTEVSQFIFSGVSPGFTVITEGLVLFGLITLLLIVEPIGALTVVTVLGIVGSLFYLGTRNRMTRWGEARQYHEGQRIQHLQEGLGGVKDAILLGRESNFINQYHFDNAKSARVGQLRVVMQQMPRLWLELIAVTCLASLVLVMLIQGAEFSSIVPTLGLFAVAAFRLLPSVNRILGAVQSLRFGLSVINTLHDEAKLAESVRLNGSETVELFRKTIMLSQVSYSYPGAQEPALNGISFEVQRGESVGFIGLSGAGKSTLVDIILGLLNPDEGSVNVDNNDIQNNIRNWQDQIGYVPQSIFLTDDTLRRNVAFGLPDDEVNEEAVWNAVKAAQLADFVGGLPQGLETNVGERGIKLSGGQRQRIGIARALYHDPAVLVLDEATSSLDIETEREVMQAVTALQGDKTIFIIAHRLTTVGHCDYLYRLENGKIIDEGKPEALLMDRTMAGSTSKL